MTILPQDYLRSLKAIRERCEKVYEAPEKLIAFDIDESRLPAIVDHVTNTTTRRFPQLDQIPPHSRLRHFDPVQLQSLRDQWAQQGVDQVEQARRLVDLVIVSVLVDAGAGQVWKYKTKNGVSIGRSEGLALASFDMFLQGYFSSQNEVPDSVDAAGLDNVTVKKMTEGFQVTETNPMVGLEGRSNLLKRLARVLEEQSVYFPSIYRESPRPGNLIDFLLSSAQENKNTVHIETLWEAVMSLSGIWPARLEVNGVAMGDVWMCDSLVDQGNFENLVPFHKLSQWLTYSLIESIELSLDIKIEGVEQMTGLPEYRNGGLLVDYGLLTLKLEQAKRGGATQEGQLPAFEGSDPVIVEWRALTVTYLDKIKKEVEKKLGRTLSLAQVLEGGTWTAGREIAAKLRPEDGGPPIVIKSDGTIF
ncbi:Uracil catabolism protein 4 [Choanephora cucurbitarum]|uniref:Uracil catabolism protein 4 n=2 Tax=Choanephora cucurbitarum TaxID=101091 RepID=A0A1C7NLC1_9FUNG|nr:Uracil catabolism protein 4 [Choanephora cucurbitarum]